MSALVLASTRRGAGKTALAIGLLEAHRAVGRRVSALKPLDVGCPYTKDHDIDAPDGRALAAATGGIVNFGDVSPYRIHADLPPSSIGEVTGVDVELADLVELSRSALAGADRLIVEAYGALGTPLVPGGDAIDLAKALDAPIGLVVPDDRDGLGASALAIAEISRRGAKLAFVVLNRVVPDFVEAWSSRHRAKIGAHAIGHHSDPTARAKAFRGLGDRLAGHE